MKKSILNLMLLSLMLSCGKNQTEELPSIFQQMDGLSYTNIDEIQGTYAAECQELTPVTKLHGLGLLKFEKNSLGQIELFQETGFSEQTNCSNGIFQEKLRGQFKIDNTRKILNINASEAALKPLSSEIAQQMNLRAECGLNFWTANNYTNILNTKCIPLNKVITYYIQSKDELNKIIVLWYCNEGQPLSSNCNRLEYKKL